MRNLLSDFFKAIATDPRIGITHIGLYTALLQHWQEHEFQNPIQVFSIEIMQKAKVSARTTYNKTIKELNDYGYIKFEASFKRNRASRITLL